MNKKQTITLTVILVLLGVIVISILFTCLKNKQTKEPDALWPEEGKVIATINEKEYRYDPVYLYRLTNLCFSEDYHASADAIFGLGPDTFSTLGILFGETQADVAVCLELLYYEGKGGNGDPHVTVYSDERLSHYGYMRSDSNTDEDNDEIIARDEASKFYKLQSDKAFISQLYPYIKKFAYIDGAAYAEHERDLIEMSGYNKQQFYDEFYSVEKSEKDKLKNAICENLKKKYHVEMVE